MGAMKTNNRMPGVYVTLGLLLIVTVLALLVGDVQAITWGEPDTTHHYVGAMVVDYPGYGPYQICTGTLIHERVVLTAGHCTVDLDAYDIETVWVNFDPDALRDV